jgi:hypothetical protein
MKSAKSFVATLLSALTLTLAVSASLLPVAATAGEWVVDGDTVTFTDHVGYDPDFNIYSGTVSLKMQNVMESGKLKITTTIVSIVPEPGFTYSVKKSGGVNGTVDIVFTSATCESRFSFLYKPGLTRIDYGVLRCR